MQKTIIADTSCFILLEKIKELDLLQKLFSTIITTPEVFAEYGQSLPTWVESKQASNKNYQTIIETFVDKGEASVIALAIEHDKSLLIIDDLKGRRLAEQLGIIITGTLGIIADAKIAGIIQSIQPILAKIKKTDFRLSETLEALMLTKAEE